jgi:uncharacterized protein with von Willebrand factor type A (vWA) domain
MHWMRPWPGPLQRREDFYWMLHAVFVKRREQREVFDQAFHVFWKKPKMLQQLMQLMYTQIARKPHENRKQAGFRRLAEAMFDKTEVASRQEQKKEALEIEATFTSSASEVLRAKDFEQMTVTEQAQAKQALRKIRLTRIEVATRRFKAAHAGRRIDMRRTTTCAGPFARAGRWWILPARSANGASRRWSSSVIFRDRAPTTRACSCISCTR